MVNKKGYIKTLEAVIAVIIVIMVSYVLIAQRIEQKPEPPLVVQDAMRFINEELQFDEIIREGIVGGTGGVKDDIASIITENKPRNYDFICAICSDSSRCYIDTPFQRSVYVSDVFIASSKEEQNPKVVRIWFWEGLRGVGDMEYKERLGCNDDCFNSLNQCNWKE